MCEHAQEVDDRVAERSRAAAVNGTREQMVFYFAEFVAYSMGLIFGFEFFFSDGVGCR